MANSGRFKKGQHWRPHKPYWDKDWLAREYQDNKRSAADISKEFGITKNAVLFWLAKHKIPARTMAEIRSGKYWGNEGSRNPMFGKRGVLNPNWSGGYTPLRQLVYASSEWTKFTKAIRKRDKVCRLCGATKPLEIHHIEPFSLAPLLVMFIGNAILLCKPCHGKMRGKERYWRKRLLALIQEGG